MKCNPVPVGTVQEFDKRCRYDGRDLGANWSPDSTVFKVWSPLAKEIQLRLYRDDRGPASETHSLTPGPQGTWSVTLPGNHAGAYYDYLVRHQDREAACTDPYARGCGCNGVRSLVVDLRQTDPAGFEEDAAPPLPPETIIYELHIKDFSYDPASGVPEPFRGKYKAFTLSGTRCMEHLRSLGVTHVHLLPFYDFGSIDEAGTPDQFNWGYDPMNYNVPEGSFATDVQDGLTRIRECKEMIQALHRQGIRVVMDVVYNHTYTADSCFGRMVPGYYYRTNPDGSLADGSCCGNDMAAGRAMVDNYIADSVLYWAKEYHIDGFRFDLMGLLTVELMNRLRRELDEAFGPGEKLLYGEPWRAAPSPMEPGTHAALKENVHLLSPGVAVFSDDTRDAIKGHVFYAKETGFVSGRPGLEQAILDAAGGWHEGAPGFRPLGCSQVVNYVSAHDNFTLWDKLVLSIHEQADYTVKSPDILEANRLAAFLYMTFQGSLFFQAGEEFGRTKLGDENSFRSSPLINMLRWDQLAEFRDLTDYYRGLIALRKRLPGLHDKSPEAWKRITDKQILGPGVVSFQVDNGEGTWDRLLIVYNGSGRKKRIALPGGELAGLADKTQAGKIRSVDPAAKYVYAQAHGGLMLGRKAGRP